MSVLKIERIRRLQTGIFKFRLRHKLLRPVFIGLYCIAFSIVIGSTIIVVRTQQINIIRVYVGPVTWKKLR